MSIAGRRVLSRSVIDTLLFLRCYWLFLATCLVYLPVPQCSLFIVDVDYGWSSKSERAFV